MNNLELEKKDQRAEKLSRMEEKKYYINTHSGLFYPIAKFAMISAFSWGHYWRMSCARQRCLRISDKFFFRKRNEQWKKLQLIAYFRREPLPYFLNY